jgi:NAD(P)-dependent dehydrogenase (short-subunit alcohol dehydrogenase family)
MHNKAVVSRKKIPLQKLHEEGSFMELQDKVCLIAGASGAIGTAVASRFFQEGARLALTYRTERPGVSEKDFFDDTGRIAYFKLDVTDYDATESVVRRVAETFSSLDVLINCTGIVGPIGPLETLDIRAWVRTIETNLIGSVHLARAVIPVMKARGCGKIVLFSGGGAAYGRPFFTPYSSSKAALVRFTESLAEELEPANIQVNAVAPGPVNSRMWEEMRAAGILGGSALLKGNQTNGSIRRRFARSRRGARRVSGVQPIESPDRPLAERHLGRLGAHRKPHGKDRFLGRVDVAPHSLTLI